MRAPGSHAFERVSRLRLATACPRLAPGLRCGSGWEGVLEDLAPAGRDGKTFRWGINRLGERRS